VADKKKEISAWDEKNLKVKESVSSTWTQARSTWSSSGIAGFLSNAKASVTAVAEEMDERLRISAVAKKVKEGAAANAATVRETLLSNSTLEGAVRELKRQINKENFANGTEQES